MIKRWGIVPAEWLKSLYQTEGIHRQMSPKDFCRVPLCYRPWNCWIGAFWKTSAFLLGVSVFESFPLIAVITAFPQLIRLVDWNKTGQLGRRKVPAGRKTLISDGWKIYEVWTENKLVRTSLKKKKCYLILCIPPLPFIFSTSQPSPSLSLSHSLYLSYSLFLLLFPTLTPVIKAD